MQKSSRLAKTHEKTQRCSEEEENNVYVRNKKTTQTRREKASATHRRGSSHGTHNTGPAYGSAERGATGEKLVVSTVHATLRSDS